MAYPAQIHLVRKTDISQHATINSDFTLPPLPECSVRAKPNLLALTLMNRTYAQLGTVLNWWCAFPPPPDLPSPYSDNNNNNNSKEWGIVPAWGFAEVIESRNELVPKKTLLFGIWPTSTLPVDLKLRRQDAPGHFFDYTPHRIKMMTVYNRYHTVDPAHPEHLRAWDANALTVWGAGWLLNQYTFAPDETKLISPTAEGHWDDRDADLSSAVVVCLGAASKIARGFIWSLSHREPGTGPHAILEITSSKEDLKPPKTSLETHVISYQDAPQWKHAEHYIRKKQPNRILLVDFGSPPGIAQRFHDHIMASSSSPSTLTYLRVGADPEALSAADPRTRTHVLNMGPVMEAAIQADGLEAVYEARRAAFRQWLEECAQGKMELQWGEGVGGENGVEGAWEKMFDGTFPRQKALVFRV